MSERPLLTGTYRLQLHAGFDLAAAADAVPYLADLGVSHLYLSPILQAAPGSTHGYDVVDHSRVSDDLGGEGAITALAEAAHRHHLGIVVDVVPNHMSVPTPLRLNRQLWHTLRDGRESEFADWFDIDWDLCGGRVGLPLLGEPLADALAAGQLSIVEHEGERVVAYHDQVFPIRPDTQPGSISDLLEQQHYLLACWREKADVLGYRRFFDVDTLIAVRVELPHVFAATHSLLVDLHSRGCIDGFRIDHPDGLADPEGYLDLLQRATGGAWVVVEKILAPGEHLSVAWSCAGTTGYDALTAVQAALAPPTGAALDTVWSEVIARERAADTLASLFETEREAKTVVVQQLLEPEICRLTRRAVEAAAARSDALTASSAKAAFEAMLVHVESYRAYLRLDHRPTADAASQIEAMIDKARRDRPDLTPALEVVHDLLLDTASASGAGRDLVVRFQQVCGPVMAKGVEDTTFYRWHRFVALNEVGGDPLSLDRPGPEWLDDWAKHQFRNHPHAMTTLSTHDTKRDEDVRGRLLAAGEQLDRWTQAWSAVRNLAAFHDVDNPTAYLLMQIVVGASPITEDRLRAYAEKAVREAKQYTTWNDPDRAYEGRVADLAAALLTDPSVAPQVTAWVRDLATSTRAVRLSAKLVQLTLPGVPDVYQGTELVQGFLVDPDNRQAVDFTHRADLLHHLDTDTAFTAASSTERLGWPEDDDKIKLWLTSRALRLRRNRPDLFGAAASYAPLESTSPYAWGFLRGDAVATVVQRWPTRLAVEGLGQTTLTLPTGVWVDVLSGQQHTVERPTDGVPCADVYRDLPVALLVREG